LDSGQNRETNDSKVVIVSKYKEQNPKQKTIKIVKLKYTYLFILQYRKKLCIMTRVIIINLNI